MKYAAIHQKFMNTTSYANINKYRERQKLPQEKSFAVHWILSQYRENFHRFAFDKNEKQLFGYILTLKIALIKLVWKTFAVCRKSAKPVKVLSCVAFVVYGSYMLII